jgi:hypothetical protein
MPIGNGICSRGNDSTLQSITLNSREAKPALIPSVIQRHAV